MSPHISSFALVAAPMLDTSSASTSRNTARDDEGSLYILATVIGVDVELIVANYISNEVGLKSPISVYGWMANACRYTKARTLHVILTPDGRDTTRNLPERRPP